MNIVQRSFGVSSHLLQLFLLPPELSVLELEGLLLISELGGEVKDHAVVRVGVSL